MVATRLPSTPETAAALLERYSARRSNGIATVSVVVGQPGADGALRRRWGAAAGRLGVVAAAESFPREDGPRRLAERADLPAAAPDCIAQLAGREPEDFWAALQAFTVADRERRLSAFPIHPDDAVLRRRVGLADQRTDLALQSSRGGSSIDSRVKFDKARWSTSPSTSDSPTSPELVAGLFNPGRVGGRCRSPIRPGGRRSGRAVERLLQRGVGCGRT